AALLLKPRTATRDPLTVIFDLTLGWFFKLFNAGFNWATGLYARQVGRLLRVTIVVLILYGGLLGLTYWSFQNAPAGFIPWQDKGWLLVNVLMPDSASVQRTREVMKDVEKLARQTPGVAHTITVSGQSILLGANGSNYGSMFIVLEPFAKRNKPELNGFAIFFKLRALYAEKVREGIVSVFPAPPVDGLGTAGGVKIMVQDRPALGPKYLHH